LPEEISTTQSPCTTHGIYPNYTQWLLEIIGFPFDLEKLTSEWLQHEGVEGSKKYFHK
jgi:hypothetical protein